MALIGAAIPNVAPGNVAHAQTPRRVYPNVRAQIVALTPARGEQEATITLNHEKIPNFMVAMRMILPLAKPSDVKRFKRGDKIRFDMTLRGGTYIAANLRPLPPKTRLQLPPRSGTR